MKTIILIISLTTFLIACKKTDFYEATAKNEDDKMEIVLSTPINCDYWTLDENGNSVYISCEPQGGGGGTNSNPYGFCETSCSNEVWIINEGSQYSGSYSYSSYNNFHFHINNPLPYDIKIEFLNLLNGNSSAGSWGNEVIIPAGQQNSPTLNNESEILNLCNGTNSGSVSKSWVISIVGVREFQSNISLNSLFQLTQNMTGVSISGICLNWAMPNDSDGDGVDDNVDLCPHMPGSSTNNGCPLSWSANDIDGDGVENILDQCRYTWGYSLKNGCP